MISGECLMASLEKSPTAGLRDGIEAASEHLRSATRGREDRTRERSAREAAVETLADHVERGVAEATRACGRWVRSVRATEPEGAGSEHRTPRTDWPAETVVRTTSGAGDRQYAGAGTLPALAGSVVLGSRSAASSPCRRVERWITEAVQVPVEEFLTESREVCETAKRWVEEEVEKPVETWVSRQERRCRELPWWNPLRWFCELVMVVVKVVTWVVVTVGKWVSYLSCKIVTTVVGIVVKLVVRLVKRLVSAVVCLFTDPAGALEQLRDLWIDVVDLAEEALDLVLDLAIHDLIDILDDVERLVDAVASSLGPIGDVLGGVLKWVLNITKDALDIVGGVLEGIKDVFSGILRLDPCRIAAGLTDIAVQIGRGLLWITRYPLGVISGWREMDHQNQVEEIIETALVEHYGDDLEGLEAARDRIGLGSWPLGLPVELLPKRAYVASDSELDLRALHREGVIDLYTLAGHMSDCNGTPLDRPNAEVVYTGTETTVSHTHLTRYIDEGPGAVPDFRVYAIDRQTFRRYLDTARRKGYQLGLELSWREIGEFPLTDREQLPLDTAVHGELFREAFSRPDTGEELCRVPLAALFGYDPDHFGLTTWYRPPSFTSPGASDEGYRASSGVSFRDRFPFHVLQYVPIHEIGHYFGLDHAGHPSPNYIMMSPKEDDLDTPETEPRWITPESVAEFALLSGEPRFSIEDAENAWRWITEVAGESCLP
jgi:hypothetical protein